MGGGMLGRYLCGGELGLLRAGDSFTLPQGLGWTPKKAGLPWDTGYKQGPAWWEGHSTRFTFRRSFCNIYCNI